jgi:hypothetical protein
MEIKLAISIDWHWSPKMMALVDDVDDGMIFAIFSFPLFNSNGNAIHISKIQLPIFCTSPGVFS